MLDNPLPVMVHWWWSRGPDRNQFITPAVDDIAKDGPSDCLQFRTHRYEFPSLHHIAIEFLGKMDVVRSTGSPRAVLTRGENDFKLPPRCQLGVHCCICSACHQ